mmetsp:Transcript_6693/g.24128  ORF Transcript_6693/g.24128 Transcript_6693/m.24128 type:complete len:247 (-) Transcript_6693:453-1193(-)
MSLFGNSEPALCIVVRITPCRSSPRLISRGHPISLSTTINFILCRILATASWLTGDPDSRVDSSTASKAPSASSLLDFTKSSAARETRRSSSSWHGRRPSAKPMCPSRRAPMFLREPPPSLTSARIEGHRPLRSSLWPSHDMKSLQKDGLAASSVLTPTQKPVRTEGRDPSPPPSRATRCSPNVSTRVARYLTAASSSSPCRASPMSEAARGATTGPEILPLGSRPQRKLTRKASLADPAENCPRT